MELDSDKLLEQAIRGALAEGMKEKLRYNNTIDTLLKSSIEKHDAKFRSMLEDAIGSCVNDDVGAKVRRRDREASQRAEERPDDPSTNHNRD